MIADWARPVVAFEILGSDPAKLQRFYGELFNWTIDGSNPAIAQIEAGIGGPEPGPVGIVRAGEPSVALYVQVLDLRTTLEKAKELGGSIILEPLAMPGRTIARIADPEGTQIGLIQQ